MLFHGTEEQVDALHDDTDERAADHIQENQLKGRIQTVNRLVSDRVDVLPPTKIPIQFTGLQLCGSVQLLDLLSKSLMVESDGVDYDAEQHQGADRINDHGHTRLPFDIGMDKLLDIGKTCDRFESPPSKPNPIIQAFDYLQRKLTVMTV